MSRLSAPRSRRKKDPVPTLELELRGAVGRLCDTFQSGSLPPECLLVGAAGTGKTWGILTLLHLLSLERAGLRFLLCRKTRESLTESVLVTYEQEVLPLTGHQSIAERVKRRVRQSYTYPNGTEWIVGGLDKPSKVLSTSYDLIFVNEAIEFEKDAWETLQSRIGRPERSHGLNALIGDTNPGDPSHWLKARCADGTCLEWVSYHRDNPALHDGRAWTEQGLAYLARLRRLTGARRKRLYEGLWAAGAGVWFETFGDAHVSTAAEFDPRWPVTLCVDSGVHTGAVWFQVRDGPDGPMVTVFGDFYAHDVHAFAVARLILARCRELYGSDRFDRGVTDPTGSARNPIGPSVLAEYERAGLRGLYHWPSFPGSVVDGLRLIESFVCEDPPSLLVHPRCVNLINSFANYRRKKRGGQYLDVPEDENHPYEECMDALRGGLQDRFPSGRRPRPQLYQRSAASMMY
jgi:hypothetical protein